MRFPAWIDRFCSVILSRQWQSVDAPTNARQARYKKQFHKLIVYIDGRYMASDSVKYRQGKDTFRYEVSCRSFGSQPRKKWLCCSPTWRERCGSGSVLGVLHNWTIFLFAIERTASSKNSETMVLRRFLKQVTILFRCPWPHIFLGMNIHLVFTRGPSWFWFTRKRIGCGRAIADCPGAQFVQLIQSGANLIWDGPTVQAQYSQRSQIRSLDDPNMTIRHGRSRWVQDFKVTGRVRSQEERHQLIIWNLMIPIFNIYYNDNEL